MPGRLAPNVAVTGLSRHLHLFAARRDGVSAVEFALIAPILILLFTATIDVPRAFSINRRLASGAGTMADLISRNDFQSLDEVYAAAQAVAEPYDVGAARIVLTAAGIYRTPEGFVAKVCSSAAQKDVPRQPGSTIGPAPLGMRIDGARYVMAEVKMQYRAVFRLVPVLNGWEFTATTLWPVREGKSVNGRDEVVLPGGRPCAAKDSA
ncbi:TadE/TadG family type IV pilus assembly protein [Methylobacterium durans]|uniref:TadE/TadG family type IV pilus assembly protein n=1 Tax=Methylobacterium durans TaxID=2202825 RepID=UPI002AFE2838|nr:TadE/TadG family type IV pilus assembly protein [Methylobacterium durans]MEA1830869.1 TadE/TadG family type IV pilus assembly protein [Methylobacterium durans]